MAHGPLDIYSVRRWPLLPPHLIAFSDSGSDLCCFDTSALEDGECPVVWWDHEGNAAQRPEPAALSFVDWLAAERRERAREGKWSYLACLVRAAGSFAREVFRGRVPGRDNSPKT